MFTGIVECVSEVRSHHKQDNGITLEVARPNSWELTNGQSIAVNGACLTVESFTDDAFLVTLVPESLAKTTFSEHVPHKVNLERAMLPTSRFDGHLVQGHIDTVGRVSSIKKEGLEVTLVIDHDPSFADLTVPKGSISLDGVSLTIVDAARDNFSVVLIPHTLEVTTLNLLENGDGVNIEFDIIGKYINNRK